MPSPWRRPHPASRATTVPVYTLAPEFVSGKPGAAVARIEFLATRAVSSDGQQASLWTARQGGTWQVVNIATGDDEFRYAQLGARKLPGGTVFREPQIDAWYVAKGTRVLPLDADAIRAVGSRGTTLAAYRARVRAAYADKLPGSAYAKKGGAGGYAPAAATPHDDPAITAAVGPTAGAGALARAGPDRSRRSWHRRRRLTVRRARGPGPRHRGSGAGGPDDHRRASALSPPASRVGGMADPSSYRPKPGQIPDSPGVYKFRDEHRRVIYVGKAKSLRQRLANYFQDLASLHPRTRTMVTTAASVEWTVVSTEVEALQLEYSWIKEFDPRFNVKYRDDKSYPYLAVTLNEEFPRVQVMRGAKKKGVRYFGPYGHAWAIRETVDLMLRVFPVRTCSAGVFKNARSRTAAPACSATSASAPRPASAGSPPRSTANWPRSSATSWPAAPAPTSAAWRSR